MTGLMLVILLGLGTWQVQRLHWKENLLATIDTRMHEQPVSVASAIDPATANYRHATAMGAFDNAHMFYLSAISQQTGEGGYDVLVPLRLLDGRSILVNRGWIPYAWKAKASFAQLDGLNAVTGILRMPERHWFQPQNNPARDDWYSIDLPAMAKIAGVSGFLPYILEAEATSGQAGAACPAGGQTRVDIPNNHLSYAITWYSFAVILLVIYFISSFRKNAED